MKKRLCQILGLLVVVSLASDITLDRLPVFVQQSINNCISPNVILSPGVKDLGPICGLKALFRAANARFVRVFGHHGLI